MALYIVLKVFHVDNLEEACGSPKFGEFPTRENKSLQSYPLHTSTRENKNTCTEKLLTINIIVTVFPHNLKQSSTTTFL